jgi:hypothetical protein
LALATDLLCDKIYIASDCKVVVDDNLNRRGGGHGNIIIEIEILSREKLHCSFSMKGGYQTRRNIAKKSMH